MGSVWKGVLFFGFKMSIPPSPYFVCRGGSVNKPAEIKPLLRQQQLAFSAVMEGTKQVAKLEFGFCGWDQGTGVAFWRCLP